MGTEVLTILLEMNIFFCLVCMEAVHETLGCTTTGISNVKYSSQQLMALERWDGIRN